MTDPQCDTIERIAKAAAEMLIAAGVRGDALTMASLRQAVDFADAEDLILYGDPDAPTPAGILHCGPSRGT